MNTKAKRILLSILAAGLLAIVFLQILPPSEISSTNASRTVADLRPPKGYTRVDAPQGSPAAFFRSLPLKKPGTKLYYYGGDSLARFQHLSYAVIDLPLLSDAEQCADVAMRLRAEYLYSRHRYLGIRNKLIVGIPLIYLGGGSRGALNSYLRSVYRICNTASLRKQLKQRPLSEVQPGDVFVYKARENKKYGHAITVIDVARNKNGQILIMCAEGNTPARDMHVMKHNGSCWVPLDTKSKRIQIASFHFAPEDLRHW